MAIQCRQCGRSNADGTQFCANPQCGAFLGWDGEPVATATWPQVPGAAGSATPATPGAGPVPGQHAAVVLELSDPILSVEPGQTASTTATVHNGGTRVEQFVVSVSGPAAPWATVEPADLSVFPGQQARCAVRFTPPRVGATAAGRAWFSVRAASTVHPGLLAAADGALDIQPFREVSAVLVPQSTAGRLRTVHRVEVTNAGNVVEPVRLQASDRDGRVRFGGPAGEVPIPPGLSTVDMPVRPPVRMVGRVRSHPFQVTVAPRPPLTPVRLDGERQSLALMPRWVPVVAAVLVLLAGVGFGAARVVPPLLRTSGGASPSPTAERTTSTPTSTPTATPTSTPSPTGSPSPSLSPTGSPSSSPSATLVLYRQGLLTIPQTYLADLDEIAVTSADADIWFEAVTATERYITPWRGGGSIAKLTQTDNAPSRCASAAFGTGRLPIAGLATGDVVCVRTNRGRLAVLTVRAPVGPSPGSLALAVQTFDR